jgi:plastocyanin
MSRDIGRITSALERGYFSNAVRVLFSIAILCGLAVTAEAQGLNVTGSVVISRPAKAKGDNSGAVVSLTPLQPQTGAPQAKKTFTIVQKDKRFDPHVLAVPAGSLVAFPNFDPFFHNVFSMFDGRRFDLGLYEAGASRTAAFPKAGVCFIFCNIHPEMTAIIVVVDTPHYTITDASGKFAFSGVAPGQYRLAVWHERAQPNAANEFPKLVTVSPAMPDLEPIKLTDSGILTVSHKNKYGRDYDTTSSGPNYK